MDEKEKDILLKEIVDAAMILIRVRGKLQKYEVQDYLGDALDCCMRVNRFIKNSDKQNCEG